jgi:hypothetical protein
MYTLLLNVTVFVLLVPQISCFMLLGIVLWQKMLPCESIKNELTYKYQRNRWLFCSTVICGTKLRWVLKHVQLSVAHCALSCWGADWICNFCIVANCAVIIPHNLREEEGNCVSNVIVNFCAEVTVTYSGTVFVLRYSYLVKVNSVWMGCHISDVIN